MTEDELLAQIRTIDPDAHVEVRGAYRIIVTDSIASNTVAFVNPANMEIFPFEMDFGDTTYFGTLPDADDLPTYEG